MSVVSPPPQQVCTRTVTCQQAAATVLSCPKQEQEQRESAERNKKVVGLVGVQGVGWCVGVPRGTASDGITGRDENPKEEGKSDEAVCEEEVRVKCLSA